MRRALITLTASSGNTCAHSWLLRSEAAAELWLGRHVAVPWSICADTRLCLRRGLLRSNSVGSGGGSVGPSRRGSVEQLDMSPWALGHVAAAAAPECRGRVARQLEPELNRVSGSTTGAAIGALDGSGSTVDGRGRVVRSLELDPLAALAAGPQGLGYSQGPARGVSRQSEPEVRSLRGASGAAAQPQAPTPLVDQPRLIHGAAAGHSGLAARGTSGSQVRSNLVLQMLSDLSKSSPLL